MQRLPPWRCENTCKGLRIGGHVGVSAANRHHFTGQRTSFNLIALILLGLPVKGCIMSNKHQVVDKFGVEHRFTNPILAETITMPEALAMWDLSRRTVEMRIWKGELETRKAVTGGTILIARASMVKLYGNEKYPFVRGLLEAGKFVHSKGEE